MEIVAAGSAARTKLSDLTFYARPPRIRSRDAAVMEDPSMSHSLRIVLFGFDQPGVLGLNALRESGHEIQACFTHPVRDRRIASVVDACSSAGIPCDAQPAQAGDAQHFRNDRPDLIVSAGYRRRVPLSFLALPRLGAINAHLAPLPSYRGPNPIAWGILSGESSWAVTIHAMTHNYNEGGILRQEPATLAETDNAYDVFQRSSRVAARAVSAAVGDIAAGGAKFVTQDLRQVRFFDSATPFGGRIDWKQPATTLAAYVRALDFGRRDEDVYEHLAPPAKATLGAQEIGIWRATAGGTASSYPPGTLTRCDSDACWVQTGRGHLAIECIVDPTGRDCSAADYFTSRGHKPGESLDTGHRWVTTGSLGFAA
jgi:methionyl-tRNA formyltransferase